MSEQTIPAGDPAIDKELSVEEYYAVVRRLDLKPTGVADVYRNPADGITHNVPVGDRYTGAQRAMFARRLKLMVRGY